MNFGVDKCVIVDSKRTVTVNSLMDSSLEKQRTYTYLDNHENLYINYKTFK